MEALDKNASFMADDDLLNFSLDDDEEDKITKKPSSSSSYSSHLESSNPVNQCPDDLSRSFPEPVEEELEWLSNKDAFPAVETGFGIICEHPGFVLNHQSPVSVLENSTSSSGSTIVSYCGSLQVTTNHPVRARSKRRFKWRRAFPSFPSHNCWWNQPSVKNNKQETPEPRVTGSGIGRRCQHCQADKTPQWRAGPMGPKTLCNACGVRYKSGRLVPEYRPASSPTFSMVLHSNSHRKIMEMRRQKHMGSEGMMVNEACGYGVG